MTTATSDEALVPLNQTGKLVPCVDGKPAVHYVTLHRWCIDGLLGIQLEHVRIGRKIYTTRTNVQRFMQQVADKRAQEGKGQ